MTRDFHFFNQDLTNDEEIPKYVCGHLAMTYTALAILLILGDDLKCINRQAIIQSLAEIQLPDGR